MHPQSSLSPPDTYTLGPWAIHGTAPSLQSPQAPTNSLNHTRHLHCGSSGHTRDKSIPVEPTGANKPPKPHQIIISWVFGLHVGPKPHTAKPTSARKTPKPHQTPAPWVLKPYQGPQLHCRAHKGPQNPLTTLDTFNVGPRAIQGTTPLLQTPQASTNPPNLTRHLHPESMRDHTLTAKPTSQQTA